MPSTSQRTTIGRPGASPRLATEQTLGYRHGMRPTSLIGRRLALVYDASVEDLPQNFQRALEAVGARLGDKDNA